MLLFKQVFLTAMMTVLLVSSHGAAYAADDVRVEIDGNHRNFSQPPVIVNDRTLVPLRDIFESLGATIQWVQESQSVIATKGTTRIVLKIGSPTAWRNDQPIHLDVEAKLINEKTMVPIRFVSESLGASVKWAGTTKSVLISSKSEYPIYYRNKVIVLTYHHFASRDFGITISPQRFKMQLDALQEHGYHVIPMKQYLDFIKTGQDLPSNAVVITVDDGYESFYKIAYPELMKRQMPATNFVVVKATDSPDHPLIPHLTWDEMREMKKHGMSFFNHTYDLHYYANTSKDGDSKPALSSPIYLTKEGRIETFEEYRTRIKNDLTLAEKRLLEELGSEEQPKLLCYPYGSYNETVINAGKEVGEELFFTVDEGINDRNQKQIYRIHAGTDTVNAVQLIEKMQKYTDTK